MKVFCVISSVGHGIGGHFYDCFDVAKMLECHGEVTTILLGNQSPILKSRSTRIIFSRFLKIRRMSFGYGDVFLAFDLISFFFVRLALIGKRARVALYKAGGPRPSGYFPHKGNLVVVSESDFNYFSPKKFNVHFLENRVVSSAPSRSALIENNLSEINFVRICRINNIYEDSIVQAYELYNSEKKSGKSLFIVGVVESEIVFSRLKERMPDAIFICDRHHTLFASRYLHYFNVVIGSGRGVYEALLSCRDARIYSITSGPRPQLVTPTNFARLQKDNFSPRCLYLPDERGDHDNEALIRAIDPYNSSQGLYDFLRSAADEIVMFDGCLLRNALYVWRRI